MKTIQSVLQSKDSDSKPNGAKLDKFFTKERELQKTHIVIILDRSGSMELIKPQTISMFNEHIDLIRSEQNKTGDQDRTFVTFTVFNNEVEQKFLARPINTLSHIDNKSYVAGGSTSLNDAIGKTLNALDANTDMNDEHSAFLVLLFTDGEENTSKEFTHSDVKELIKKREATGKWTFVYIGTENLDKIERDYGFLKTCAINYAPTARGVNSVNRVSTDSVSAYLCERKMGQTAKANMFSDEQKAAVDPNQGSMWVSDSTANPVDQTVTNIGG